MAELPVQPASDSAAVSFVSAAAAQTFGYGRHRAIRVRNGAGAPINVTIVAQEACDQGTLHDRVVAVAAGAEKTIPAGSSKYADANGQVHVNYSSTTTVTVAAVGN